MQKYDKKRRFVTKALALLAFLAAFPKAAYGFFVKNFPVRTVETKGFAFDPGKGIFTDETGKQSPYFLVVDGLVEKPLRLSYRQLQEIKAIEQVSDFHCVEGWSVPDLKWQGVRPKQLLDLAGIKENASYVTFHALGKTSHKPGGLDHYVESYSIKDLVNPEKEMILAYGLNSGPLPLDHGAPLRLISPYDMAYKSIKYVWRLEVTDKPDKGWWTRANPIYPYKAPVPKHRIRPKKS